MDCEDIIERYLAVNGYDGLYNEVSGCGCEIGNLFSCGEDFSGCKPGYRVVPPEGTDCDFDIYIVTDKNHEPWRWE